MKRIKIKGNDFPAELNGAAMEIIAEEAGSDITSFIETLGAVSSSGKLDIKAVVTFLYACLVGGAVAEGNEFQYTRKQVASWLTLENIGDVLNELIALLPGVEDSEEPAPAATGQKKMKG